MAQVPTQEIMTTNDIIKYCGPVFYRRGYQYVKEGRVKALAPGSPDPFLYQARVRGTESYLVSLFYGGDGRFMSSHCECPAFPAHGVCKHIAAVLIERAEPPANSPPQNISSPHPAQSSPTSRTTARFLDVFRVPRSPALSNSSKEILRLEYLIGVAESGSATVFTLEMKIGTDKRLYIVPKVPEFLREVRDGAVHTFSKLFTYDPRAHTFEPSDRKVLEILFQALDHSLFYTQTQQNTNYQSYRYNFYGTRARSDRTMSLPPFIWQQLASVLPEVRAFWSRNPVLPVRISKSSIPLLFKLEETKAPSSPTSADKSYVLSYEKPKLKVLPLYGSAVREPDIYLISRRQADLLHQILAIPSSSKAVKIPLESREMEDVVTEVLPQLDGLGQLRLSPDIASVIVSEPLKPRVYLDWDGEGIEAQLHFVYGSTIIVAGDPSSGASSSQIIRRDRVEEARITSRLIDAGFHQDESRFVLTEDEAIYQFMSETLEELTHEMDVRVSELFDPVHHVSSSPKVRMDMDPEHSWLEVSFEWGDLEEDDILAVLRALKEKRRYHRLTNGQFLPLEEAGFEAAQKVLEELDIDPDDLNGSGTTVPALRAVPLVDPSHPYQTQWELGKSLRRWLDDLRHPDNLDVAAPASLTAKLRNYQVTGFLWMKMLSRYGFGGILADDMGLGKTLQSITYLLSERESKNWENPALIVAPASLIYNWHREFEMFAPTLKTQVLAGDPKERQQMLEEAKNNGIDVLITSYPLLRRDLAYYRQHTFHAVIFDEAQTLKNSGTQAAQAAYQIKSSHRFALTGTPMENRLTDLWSIFRAVFPELLGSHKKFSQTTPDQLRKQVRPFILRRLKQDVLKDLPEKIESVETTELTREQKSIYLAYLEKVQADTQSDLARDGFQKSRIKILAALTRLRQICCHPALFMDNYQGTSAKMDLLLELVEESLESDHRLLIFSQFTSMLKMIAQNFDDRGWSYFYLDGDTPVNERLQLVSRFNQGERSAFLISLKAGGTGLNLTGADTVILYDLWWNPAVESQAADRAHRIGQKKVVQVMRLITQGTIEEKIYALQRKKQDLVDQVIRSQGEDIPSITEEDIRQILQLS